MKLAAAARPAKLDIRSLTKANLDASGVADASPLSARSKLRRFASTSDLPPAIQPPMSIVLVLIHKHTSHIRHFGYVPII